MPTCATCRRSASPAPTTCASGGQPLGRCRTLPDAAEKPAACLGPRYFLDFETVGPAVPLWPGTRPYQKIPMQWSCHRQDADGDLAQLPPFLATGEGDPRRPLCGGAGRRHR
ncbi:MAG: DUF2779 domain-containing protein [Betaproteobacteria bacterium]|nr:DUF2779 domain-containing protein [Betaproteobacteria bacterium]